MITKIKFILKLLIPPFIVISYKKFRWSSSNQKTFRGIYKNFEEVPITSNYSNKISQNEIHNNLVQLIADHKRNIYHVNERSQITNLLPLLLSLLDKEKISLLDFGGGAGETYIDYINKLRTKKIIDYYLYDFEETTQIGKRLFLDFHHEYSNIKFINAVSEIKSCDIVYLGSSLQYFPDYKSILLTLVSKNPRYILITDNFITKNHKAYVTVQVNMSPRNMACWIFNFDEIVSFLSENNYGLIYSSSNFQPFLNLENFPDDILVKDSSNLLFEKNIISNSEKIRTESARG